MEIDKIFEKSIVISAHPDDEILWFSSILDKVDKVVICFLGIKSEPNRRVERQKSLSEYPFKKISCLDIDQSETFYGVNWENPVLTKYGIEISNKKYPDKTYKENYYKLKEQLETKLSGYHNVFTHNPWGEYGSDEHIQIYRVIKDLQKSLNFNLWFSNYVSNKSFKLMLSYISTNNLEYITFQTNKLLAADIKNLYQKNRCWTWYDDWEWCNEELFIKDKNIEEKNIKFGQTLPLNFIKIWHPIESKRIFNRLWSQICKILRYFKNI